MKGGRSILNNYKGSLRRALADSFTELQFDGSIRGIALTEIQVNLLSADTVKRRPSGYWEDITNRQRFFCEYAKEAGFDPFQPENWEKVQNHQIQAKEVRRAPFPMWSYHLLLSSLFDRAGTLFYPNTAITCD